MAGKKLTIVIVPDGAHKVRQLKVRKSFLFLFLLVFLGAGVLFAWWVQNYQSLKIAAPRLKGLEKENVQQKLQLVALDKKMGQVGKKLLKLKEFDSRLRTMVNLKAKKGGMPFLGVGGVDPVISDPKDSAEQTHRQMIRRMHQSLDNLDTEISIQTKEKVELIKFLEGQMSVFARTPSIWPTKGWISSGFGYRISPFTNQREFHAGLDIVARNKAPIVAPADGIVVFVGKEYGYGNVVKINHGNGLQTLYAHLSKALVKKGQSVKRGQEIALVGVTGRTTGPHLHYEVHLDGVPVNPRRYILN